MTAEELEQRRRTLDAKGGDWQTPPTARQWHLAQAAEAEADKDWFAVRFHLNWLLRRPTWRRLDIGWGAPLE